nr:MAG TPA: hypothetical protein [Caudoviricetes sp.]
MNLNELLHQLLLQLVHLNLSQYLICHNQFYNIYFLHFLIPIYS